LEEEESNKRIILASSSPRRRRILELLKVGFQIIEPHNCQEKLFRSPFKTVTCNSLIKAQDVYNRVIINNLSYTDTLVVSFDTIVYLNGKYFGKPQSIEEAGNFIRAFSNRTHSVISGVTVLDSKTGSYLSDFEITKVKFKKLGSFEIDSYLKQEYVLDKAGAYDIYGFGAVLVEKINGCFYNVAGLPVFKFFNLLEKFEYKFLGS